MKFVDWSVIGKNSPELLTKGLTLEEEAALRELLMKVQIGGRMSPFVFLWSRAAFVSSALEGIFLKRNDVGDLFVLLHQRPENVNDVAYSGKWDVFGTVLLPSDTLTQDELGWDDPVQCYQRPLSRILGEVGIQAFGDAPIIAGSRLFEGDRGPVNQTIAFLTIPKGVKPNGKWFLVDDLPEELIEEHHSLIAFAVALYRS